MARNTRTFTDIDLNFIPSPLNLVMNDGIGTITCSTTSPTVTGIGTSFNTYSIVNGDLYVDSFTHVGKVKSIESSVSLTLYKNANITRVSYIFNYSIPADIVKRYDGDAVKASIRNLLLTSNYEKPFHPEIGTQISSLLFDLNTPMLSSVMEKMIRYTINNYEPRVELTGVSVDVSPDSNSVDVSIAFTILNTQTPQILNMVLERTR